MDLYEVIDTMFFIESFLIMLFQFLLFKGGITVANWIWWPLDIILLLFFIFGLLERN